jgi:hypothetical protein
LTELSKADTQLSKAEIELSRAEASLGRLEAVWSRAAEITIGLLLLVIGWGISMIIVASREESAYKKFIKSQNND